MRCALDKAEILARLSERHRCIAASEPSRETRQTVQRTLDALENKHSYYAVLSSQEREQVRAKWQQLAISLGVRPIRNKHRVCSKKPALELPPRVMQFFGGSECLPHRPRGADDYTLGIQRMSWERAQNLRSIEINPPAHVYWLLFDCDHADHNQWKVAGLPEPSFITVNPANGHHHVAYRLIAPVCRSENAHARPRAYLRAVQEAMRQALRGDPHYAGVLTKNPLHPAWTTICAENMPAYSLAQLHRTIDLQQASGSTSKVSKVRRNRITPSLAEVGIGGRNHALFNAVRLRPAAEQDVQAYAERCNELFHQPLPGSEVIAIANSIERYEATRHGRNASEAFRSTQAARGRLGGRPLRSGQCQPWLALGISRATWYRQQQRSMPTSAQPNKRLGRPAVTKNTQPWLARGISRAKWYREQKAAQGDSEAR